MSVAADDCFARSDVAELTIALATEGSSALPASGERLAAKAIAGLPVWPVRSGAYVASTSSRASEIRVRAQRSPPRDPWQWPVALPSSLRRSPHTQASQRGIASRYV